MKRKDRIFFDMMSLDFLIENFIMTDLIRREERKILGSLVQRRGGRFGHLNG